MTLAVAPDRPVVTSEVAVRDILQFGSALVTLPVSHLEKPMIDGFLRFLKLPEEYRKRWRFLDSGVWCPDPDPKKKEDPDTGYLVPRNGQKAPDGRTWDPNKETVHVSTQLPKFLADYGVPIDAETRSWLDVCLEAMRICNEVARRLADDLDRQLPGYNFAERISAVVAQMMNKLRFLFYGGGASEGVVLGKDHFDRNGWTLHGGDSRPGLVIYDSQHRPWLFRVQPGSALWFPGAKLQKLTQGLLKAMLHKIVATGEGYHLPRWCWVYFVHIELELEPKDLEVVS